MQFQLLSLFTLNLILNICHIIQAGSQFNCLPLQSYQQNKADGIMENHLLLCAIFYREVCNFTEQKT